mgnify:CR=1 FL=1
MSENKSQPNEDIKIEDILTSIRNIIDENDKKEKDEMLSEKKDISSEKNKIQSKEVLELTEVMEDNNQDISKIEDSSSMLSNKVKDETSGIINNYMRVANLKTGKDNQSDELLKMVEQIMRPLIKEWLNNNLKNIVEKVVTNEIKKLTK